MTPKVVQTVFVLCLFLTQCGPSSPQEVSNSRLNDLPAPHIKVVETAPLSIDKLYKSMVGPSERVAMDTSGLDWITSIETEVVDAKTRTPLGREFFCHSQLQINSGARLMVHATGGEATRLPKGFGIPIDRLFRLSAAAKDLTFLGMVLNNHQPEIDQQARIRATIKYHTNEEVGHPPKLKKLYHTDVTMWVNDLADYEPIFDPLAPDDITTHCSLVQGQNVHWMVPPGTQKTRRLVKQAIVPVDATVHVAQAHLHNYGRWVQLTDATTGELVWRAEATYESERDQITEITTYSSEEGFSIFADHEYVIEAFYDNTTDHDVDAMAVIYFYVNPANNADFMLPKGPRNQVGG